MKVLYITNIAPIEGITNFSIATQLACQEIGLEFHIAKNFNATPQNIRKQCEKEFKIKIHHIDLKRNSFHPRNIIAIRQLINILSKEKIDIIHCNTPTGGVIGRIAGKIANTKVIIYQSHGFHFYKNAPLKNWLLYYTAERLLARLTDVLLTINEEDYTNAQKFHLRKNGKIYSTLGVGLDVNKFCKCDVNVKEYRKLLDIPEDAIVLLTVGEVAKRKNQLILIKALKIINDSNIYLLICGEGPLSSDLKHYCKIIGLEKNIKLLGRRNDIPELCKISDIYCFPSMREGMGIAALEGMASGLPLISSNIQGIRDYSITGKTGFCLKYDDLHGFVHAIKMLAYNKELREKYGNYNKEFVKKYNRNNCIKIYKSIYEDVINNYFN